MTTPQRPQRKPGPLFRPITKADFFEDIPLHGRPEFRGGILVADRQEAEMEVETKEITSAPSTETKDAEVKSGTKRDEEERAE